MASAATREHAHELIDHIPEAQLAAAVAVLEKMVDPVEYALANAAWEDERISAEEEKASARARAAGYVPSPVSHEEFLKEFGLTLAEFERMGDTPVEPEQPLRKHA